MFEVSHWREASSLPRSGSGRRAPVLRALVLLVSSLVVLLAVSVSAAGAARDPAGVQYGAPTSVCHKNADGRFVVITIDQSSLAGHLAHGDIHPVPSGGCAREINVRGVTSPPSDDDVLRTVANQNLPFTGLPLWIFVVAGLPLLALGFGLRRLGSGKAE